MMGIPGDWEDRAYWKLHAKHSKLRAALEEIVTTDPPKPGPGIDWFQEWKNLAFRLKGIARTALVNEGGYHEDTIQSKEASRCAGSDPAPSGQ